MAEALRLPRMSDTMEEGVIAELKIKLGDTVSTGDVIAEVETDKATMEWESFQEGKVLYVAVQSGDTVPIDTLVAILGKDGEDFQHLLVENGPAPKEEAVETSKEDDTVNTIEFDIAEEEQAHAEDGRIKASPLAKKIAEEQGVPIQKIQGSGEEGRIVRKDVENFLAQKEQTPVTTEKFAPTEAAPQQASPAFVAPTFVGEESFTEEKVSQMRKVIAKRLSESMFQAPHFYLTIEVNMNLAMTARQQMNEVSPVKISFNDIIIKACAAALRKHPAINSSWLGDKIRYNHHIHIGMAVAVPEGLLVPVIKFADNKTLSQLAAEAKNLAEKAKSKKLLPEEMQGNTFSISNLGGFGINEFTAVINPPDACILAVGSIKQELAFDANKNVVENNIMKLTLSCDHRVVDGAVGTQFLLELKRFLENPITLLV